jgi:hypothetical protein
VSAQLALALFKLVTGLVRIFEEQRWYQDGRAAAYAEMDQEQRKRIDMAEAARHDADAFAGDGVRDPRQRD